MAGIMADKHKYKHVIWQITTSCDISTYKACSQNLKCHVGQTPFHGCVVSHARSRNYRFEMSNVMCKCVTGPLPERWNVARYLLLKCQMVYTSRHNRLQCIDRALVVKWNFSPGKVPEWQIAERWLALPGSCILHDYFGKKSN